MDVEDEGIAEDIVEVEWNIKKDESVNRFNLIGKLMSSKSFNRNALRNLAMKIRNVSDLKISEMENNLFIFSFGKDVDRRRVLRNRSWTITGILLVIQEWCPMLPINEIQWNFSPFWIQFHGMSLGGLSCKNAGILGSRIGDILEVEDPVVNGRVMRDFLRARVLVDISKPLMCGVWIPRPNMEKVWISIKYENLHVFCFKCGIVNHDFREYKKRRVLMSDDFGQPKYGAWLGTNPLRSRKDDFIKPQEDEWRWRSADELKMEEGGASSAQNMECGVNAQDVPSAGFEKDREFPASSSKCEVDEIVREQPIIDESPSTSVYGLERGTWKRISGKLCRNNTTVVANRVNHSFVSKEVNKLTYWDDNDYYVELPSDSVSVNVTPRMEVEGFNLLTDGMEKISLKKKCAETEKWWCG